MTEPAALVYDLDGTLVRLRVDWDAVAADVAAIFRDEAIDVEEPDLWEMLERADDHGLREPVENTIAEHERDGARRSVRLSSADDLVSTDRPVAVCSLNCEAACRIALETHELVDHVETIVGRDSVSTHKPDPEPLLAAVRGLAVDPSETLFIGDSPRDEVTANRAGTRFAYADQHVLHR